MTQCSPSELPAIAKMQKKKHKTQEEMDPSGEDVPDRLYVLAALKDAWTAVSLSSAKSMVLITDGGDVAGQSITLCYGFVPGIGRGFLLPHQVPIHHPVPCVFAMDLLSCLRCFLPCPN